MSVYTAEETEAGVWSILDLNVGGTGARVLDAQSEEAAEFYAEMMNLMYGRVMKDVKELTK
jgi:hypothetical protein